MKHLENLLDNWAWFYGFSDHNGTGYPSMNILAKFKENGGIIITGQGAKLPSENEAADMIEKLVVRLNLYDDRLSTALRAKYFCRRYESAKQIAKKLSISESMFNARVQRAKDWLSGHLDSVNYHSQQ